MHLERLFTMSMLVIAPWFGGCTELADGGDADEASSITASMADRDDRALLGDVDRAPGARDVASLGSFHVIQNVANGKCLQPAGGSIAEGTTIVQGECGDRTAPILLWDLVPVGNDFQFRNIASGLCLYNDAPLPLRDFARPINVQHCGDSNTLWQLQRRVGITTIMSKVQFRATGFCIDVPQRTANNDVPMQNFHCGNDNLAQLWIVDEL